MKERQQAVHTSRTYSRTQVALHWAIVVLLAAQYLLHGGIETAWQGRLDGTIPNAPFPNPHAIVGMIILALTLWRIVLLVRLGAPALPIEEAQTLRRVARITHLAFYVLLIAMPVSGALAWVLGLEMPAEAHESGAKVMLALVALHVTGALVQQFVLKTGVMERMSPKRMLRQNGSKGALS